MKEFLQKFNISERVTNVVFAVITAIVAGTILSVPIQLNGLGNSIERVSADIKDISSKIDIGLDRLQTDQKILKQESNKNLKTAMSILSAAFRTGMSGNQEKAEGMLESIDFIFGNLTDEAGNSPLSSIRIYSTLTGKEIDLKERLNSLNELGRHVPVFDTIREPQWNPVVPQLLFSGSTNGSYDLFVYDFLLEQCVQLTRDTLREREAKWSNDGKQIVFTRFDIIIDEDGKNHSVSVVYMLDLPLNAMFDSNLDISENINVRHILGGKNDSLWRAFFPSFSPFEGWITITAHAKDDSSYTIYMADITSSDTRTFRLFSEATMTECKGNWWYSKNSGGLFVYNRYDSSDNAGILLANVSFAPTCKSIGDSPFEIVTNVVVIDNEMENHFPDFGGSPNTIIYASSDPSIDDSLQRIEIKRVSWNAQSNDFDESEVLHSSNSTSFERPDWRSSYKLHHILKYYENWQNLIGL